MSAVEFDQLIVNTAISSLLK